MPEPILVQNNLVDNAGVSLATNSFTTPVELKKVIGYCMMVNNTGSAIGVQSLQVSPDGPESLYGVSGGLWFDLPGTQLAVTGGGNTNVWNIERAMYPYVRIKYVSTSGSGTMFDYVSTKNL